MTSITKVKSIKNLIQNWESRIGWDEYFMGLALLASSRSSCNRLHVGCVLVKDKRVISMGYNGFLSGAPHISRVRDNHEQSTVHAEQNAVTDCAKRGVCCIGSTAYITHYPCINCTKILSASGIDKIIYNEDYKNDELVKELLNDTNILIKKLD